MRLYLIHTTVLVSGGARGGSQRNGPSAEAEAIASQHVPPMAWVSSRTTPSDRDRRCAGKAALEAGGGEQNNARPHAAPNPLPRPPFKSHLLLIVVTPVFKRCCGDRRLRRAVPWIRRAAGARAPWRSRCPPRSSCSSTWRGGAELARHFGEHVPQAAAQRGSHAAGLAAQPAHRAHLPRPERGFDGSLG